MIKPPIVKNMTTSKTHSNVPKNFRGEIAGLRAVAVLGVVIFHAGLHQLAGGYVGVDVFFVISGFLIINIIVRDLEADRFNFLSFYARRVKRLFPAAFALITATVLFGSLSLYPDAYVAASKSGAASLGFVANIYFYFNTGYFDQSADVLPLLHMWSLGIEEQFYLFSPVLLFLIFRLGSKRDVIWFLIVVALTSFIMCLWISQVNSKFAFFQLPTRAWQFAIGGLLAFTPRLRSPVIGNILSAAGLFSIVLAMFVLEEGIGYPSWYAVLPTLGCAAIIYGTQTQRNLVRSVLSLAPLQWVGKVSYSTYLWHWPVIVYYRIYILEREFTAIEIVGLTAVSLLLGWVSWMLFEERFRHSKKPAGATNIIGLGGAAILALIPATVILGGGFSSRVDAEAASLLDRDTMWDYECVDQILLPGSGQTCVVGVPWAEAEHKGVLWGDSHSEHYAPIFHEVAKSRNMAIVVGPRSCPPFVHEDSVIVYQPGRDNFTNVCTSKRDAIVGWLDSNLDVEFVIMASAWAGYTHTDYLSGPDATQAEPLRTVELIESGMRRALALTDNKDRNILLVGDVPRPFANLNPCAATLMNSLLRQSDCVYELSYLSAENVDIKQGETNDLLARLAAESNSVEFLPVTDRMCDDERCNTYINGEFIYRDNNHIRRNMDVKTNNAIMRKLELDVYFDRVMQK